MNVIRDVRQVPVGVEPQVTVERKRFRFRTWNWRRTLDQFLGQLGCTLELFAALGGPSIMSHGPSWQPMPSDLHRPYLSKGCVYVHEPDAERDATQR